MEYNNIEYNYQSFFKKIVDGHGTPDFIIGVTFGVDIDKWRSINKTIFGLEFSEKTKFEKSFLFTDKVYIKDTNQNRDLYNGNLMYAIPGVDGYLHTKFVLLCYKEKYVLVLSTKNISGNKSYDCILPLVFEKNSKENEINEANGSKVKAYLSYLIEKSENYEIPEVLKECINNLEQFQITSSLEGFNVGLFEFAYGNGGNRIKFSKELWQKVLDSQEIVSPYLDAETIKTIANNTYVLAYPEQIEKVCGEIGNKNIQFRVGKGVYKNDCLVTQRKYHSKLYFYWDKDNKQGSMIVGSANLTSNARNTHCEMLVELITKDEKLYNSKSAFFYDEENCTEEYDHRKDYSVYIDDEEDFDDESPKPIVGNNCSIYVKKENDLFQVHIISGSNNTKKDEIWGAPYSVASYYVVCGQQMLLVDQSRYISDDEIVNYTGALSYKDYSQFVEDNKERLQKESDKSLLSGKKTEFSISQGVGRKNEGTRVIVEDIPCLFDTVFRKLETKRNRPAEDTNISKDLIVEELKNIRNSLFNKEWIKQINDILRRYEDE